MPAHTFCQNRKMTLLTEKLSLFPGLSARLCGARSLSPACVPAATAPPLHLSTRLPNHGAFPPTLCLRDLYPLPCRPVTACFLCQFLACRPATYSAAMNHFAHWPFSIVLFFSCRCHVRSFCVAQCIAVRWWLVSLSRLFSG